ncbi:MAG: hypothetical protein WD894_09100 [Pirellulales bacterium]
MPSASSAGRPSATPAAPTGSTSKQTLAEPFTIDVGCHIDAHAHIVFASPSLPLSQSSPFLVSPSFSPAHCFSHDAAPAWDPNSNVAPSNLDAGPGITLPAEKTVASKQPRKTSKKLGRPAVFDESMRARFCGKIETGCTLRYAAKRLGISRGTVAYACRTDPEFANRVRRAEQQRDLTSVGRIQNAGEKSWRAAAWLLERNAPDHFSLRPQNRDSAKQLLTQMPLIKLLGKRRFKQLLADAVQEVHSHASQTPNPSAPARPPQRSSKPTIEEIESQLQLLLEGMDFHERFDLLCRLDYSTAHFFAPPPLSNRREVKNK